MSQQKPKPDPATLEAVYNINKHAKKYGRKAEESWNKRSKTTARKNSVRKKALYAIKDEALKDILRERDPDTVELHHIHDRVCWFLKYGIWGYHVPRDRVDSGPWKKLPGLLEDPDEDPEVLDDFESTEEKEHSDRTLKASLLHLEACGYNANEYLEETHVSYGHQSRFIGWKYLDEGGERMTPTETKEESDTTSEADMLECDACGKECKGQRGLSIHQTMAHDGMTIEGRDDSRLEVDDPGFCKECGWSLEDEGTEGDLCQQCQGEAAA